MNEVELMQEIVQEDIALIQELYDEEIKPILQYKQKLERMAFDKVYEEVQKLEEELRTYSKVEKLIGGLSG